MAPTLRSRQTAFSKKDVKKLASKKPAVQKTDDVPVSPHPSEIGLNFPKADVAFKVLLTARFCAAIWSNITDCDETYNFWEPSHYVLYGKGFQTWEYSPEFALRSYTYLMVNMFPAWLYSQLFQANRMLTFYFSRCLFAFVCAQCELYFYKAVCREFGVAIGRLTLAFLLFSAGMFISSTAFLPSTFSMYMTLLSMAAWFQRKYELSILTTALSAFLSWPFAGLIGLPIAMDLILKRGDITRFLRWSAISTATIVPLMVWLDSQYYGRFVFAPINIVLYNVFTSHGPDLYGTEAWSFYFINCFLNFNFVAIFAILTPFVLILSELIVKSQPRHSACLPFWLSLMPLYLWCFVFFLQPHKEERFLFPVYPLICLCGAVTVDTLQKLWFALMMRLRKKRKEDGKPLHYLNDTSFIFIITLVICSVFGLSRILTLYKGYHAPMDILMELGSPDSSGELPKKGNINVCIGKEWHRFPSSFFLPNDRFQLQFLQSEFRGQLPAPYSSGPNATSIIPKNMNSENKEEPSRYFPVEKCHFIIDSYLGYESDLEPNYANSSAWAVVKSLPFLNAVKSDKFFRAFHIPFLSSKFCDYGMYYLLKSVQS